MRLPCIACVALAASSCLPDAIPESARKDLVNGEERYAVGLWVNNYPAGHASAELVHIIVQEVLGFNVEIKGFGANSPPGFYAIAGCTAPQNVSNPMCGATTTYVHINVEAWSGGYRTLLAQMEADMPSMAPRDLGSMGYGGVSAIYIPQRVQKAAYEADAEPLEYFRAYNASRKTPWRFFDRPRDIDTNRLLPCTETELMDSRRMKQYAEISGDAEGVVVEGNITKGRCFDSFFWLSPACRQDPDRCVVTFTGGNGWGLDEFMQKSSAHQMPLALAVASSWDNYVTLPQDYACLTYWWEPDNAHLSLDPRRIVFPAHDVQGHARGDKSSDTVDVEIVKQVSQDLGRLAPEVEAFLSNFKIDLKSMKALLVDQMESQDGWSEVACRWLSANEPTWKQWIPDSSECYAGFGMFDRQEGFVSARPDPSAIICRPCPPGHASELLRDGRGTTHVCSKCEAGTHQAAGYSLACDPCPAGEFQDEQGAAICKRCPIGLYQDDIRQEACKACPAGTTTVGLGSLSLSDCGCKPNTINVLETTTSFQCVACSKGLHCPLSSSITTLRNGEAILGEDYTPKVMKGYYSSMKEPLRIWECKPESGCPGGKPGECEGGLEGVPCSRCPNGQTLVEGLCRDCVGGAFIPLLVLLLLGLVMLTKSYDLLNKPVRSKASPFTSILLGAAFTVNVLQVVAIFGMMTLQWSDDFDATSGALQIFMLDLQTFGLSCILGPTPLGSFLLRAIIFPGAALWLLVCYVASRLRGKAWKFNRVFNTLGTLFAAGFGTMAAVAMQPLMCYQHPNGQSSLLKYPDVICGSSQHSQMLASGVALGVLALGFFAACCYAGWKMPAWSQEGSRSMQAFRFLHGNFRLSAWWFGLLPLVRGFGFAFSIVVATNFPAVQVAVASVLLLAYVILQSQLQPWKARLTNIMDLLLSALLLLLIRASTQEDREEEERFAAVWTLITLCLLTFFLVFMIFSGVVALCLEWRGRDSERLLNMGQSWVVEQEVQALKNCAQALLEAEADQLMSGLQQLNPYDLKQLANTIEIFDGLLATRFASRSTRLQSGGINRLSVAFESDPRGDLAPTKFEAEASKDPPTEPVAEANAHEESGAELLPTPTNEAVEPNVGQMISLEC